MKILLLIPFLALLLFSSCQEEIVDVSQPEDSETLTARSELTKLMSSTSILDGSDDNIIDLASCTSVKLPVTVKVNNLEIIINSKANFKDIEAIYNEFEDDIDALDIIFPITIILSNHEEIVIQNQDALETLIKDCKGENEVDDDIECIDFQYPMSFSIFNPDFQIIDVVAIENDRALYRFLNRVKSEEIIASISFPITLKYTDGETVDVNNNQELASIINQAKDACDEDDDNDFGDDDFTKAQLDAYLTTCPWVVSQFIRFEQDVTTEYKDYALSFKENNVVVMRERNGDVVTGTWSTRVTDRGALLKLELESLTDFNLEWIANDLGNSKIKLHEEEGNRIIINKNCNLVVDVTKEGVENILQECLWQVAQLNVNGVANEKEYIGTPLKFFENNVVKLRVMGEFLEGTYNVETVNNGFTLQVTLDNRPNLTLAWLITFLENDLIKFTNGNNQMILNRHCPGEDSDLNFTDEILISEKWEVTSYIVNGQDSPDEFLNYTLDFKETGSVEVTEPNPNNSTFSGSWLAYRNDGLKLDLFFGNNAPFNDLNNSWKISETISNRIELRGFNSNTQADVLLVLEKIQ